jgi:putative modified peptide
LTDADLTTLRRALESDPAFRERFDADPVAAVEAAGLPELAVGLEREMRELVALAERVANDSRFRAELDADPVAALTAAGMPAATAEPLLQALALPDEVLAKLPEVVAHGHERPEHEEQLLMLLLGSAAVVRRIRAARPRS